MVWQTGKSGEMVTLVVTINALSHTSNTRIMLPNMQSSLQSCCLCKATEKWEIQSSYKIVFILSKLVFHLDFTNIHAICHLLITFYRHCNLLQRQKYNSMSFTSVTYY